MSHVPKKMLVAQTRTSLFMSPVFAADCLQFVKNQTDIYAQVTLTTFCTQIAFFFYSGVRHKTKNWLYFTHFKRFIDRKWVAFGNTKAKNVT